MERLLKLRKEIKKRKPKYVRQQYGYFARLSKVAKWRKPRGIHSKILMRRKGHRKMPEVGYGSPKAVKGLNRFGKREVLVYNIKDLDKVDKKLDSVVIASTVGKKKRLDILKKCKELKLEVSNYKSIETGIEKIEKLLLKKKELKKEREIKKQNRENKRESKKKVEKKENKEEKVNISESKNIAVEKENKAKETKKVIRNKKIDSTIKGGN